MANFLTLWISENVFIVSSLWVGIWLVLEFQIQINFPTRSDVRLNLISSYISWFFFLGVYMIFLFMLSVLKFYASAFKCDFSLVFLLAFCGSLKKHKTKTKHVFGLIPKYILRKTKTTIIPQPR